MSIVCHDVFEHILLSQDVSIFTVPLQPESRSLMIKVVSNSQIVHSHSLDIMINLLLIAQIILFNILSLCKYVVSLWSIFTFFLLLFCLGHQVFHVHDFFFIVFARLWFTSHFRNHLGVHFNHFSILICFWINRFCPTIIQFYFLNTLRSIFYICNSARAWNLFGDEELLLIWESLVHF